MSHPDCLQFRFVVFNDWHVTRARTAFDGIHGDSDASTRANWAVAWARGETEGSTPADMVVSAGDLAHGEREEVDQEFQDLQSTILEPLQRPLLPCAGNHENLQGEGNKDRCRAYERCCGPGRWNHILVDSSGGRTPDAVAEKRNAFVARALSVLRGKPTLMVTDVPLVPMRHEPVLAKSFGFRCWCNRDPVMLQQIESCADQVLAVISRHLHLTGTCVRKGIHHMVPSGTASFPSDLASFSAYPDRIDVAMHSVPLSVRGPGEPGSIGMGRSLPTGGTAAAGSTCRVSTTNGAS